MRRSKVHGVVLLLVLCVIQYWHDALKQFIPSTELSGCSL